MPHSPYTHAGKLQLLSIVAVLGIFTGTRTPICPPHKALYYNKAVMPHPEQVYPRVVTTGQSSHVSSIPYPSIIPNETLFTRAPVASPFSTFHLGDP